MAKDPYKKTAKRYDRYVEPFIAVIRQIGIKMCPPQEGMLVLDVGCGTGTNLKLYQDSGCKVFGIDLSPAMVKEAQNKLGDRAEICQGDAAKMAYQDDLFDLVIGFFTLHEMPNQIRPAVISEMVRVTKPDGRILLIDQHSGPFHFPMGWIYRAVVLFFETMAGREHFKNHRDFISRKGLPNLISTQNLRVVSKKIVSEGNIALFIVNSE